MVDFDPQTYLLLEENKNRCKTIFPLLIIAAILIISGVFLLLFIKESSSDTIGSTKASVCDAMPNLNDLMEKCGAVDIGCMCKRIQTKFDVCKSIGSEDYQAAMVSATACCQKDLNSCTPEAFNLLATVKNSSAIVSSTSSSTTTTSTAVVKQDSNQLNSTTLIGISIGIFLIAIFAGFALCMLRQTSSSHRESHAENHYKPTAPVVVANSATTVNGYVGCESLPCSAGSQISLASPHQSVVGGPSKQINSYLHVHDKDAVIIDTYRRSSGQIYANEINQDRIYQESVVTSEYLNQL